MNKPKYRIYPSLLDKFQSFVETTAEDYFYQDKDGNWHKNYNDSTGEYYYSDSEVYELAKADLINMINRVRSTSEAASKGTAFNELVDAMITGCRSEVVKTKKVYHDVNGNLIFSDMPLSREIFKLTGVQAELDGFTFMFSIDLVKDAADYFNGCINQVFTSALIDTDYGIVELYGYVDELRKNKVYDIKTTNKYDFGKYKKYWQQHVYPYCLIESGECKDIDSFEFTCYQLSGGTDKQKLITGKKYTEVYKYQHDYSKMLIKAQCERLIEFLEENKELITDKKVFGGEN